MDQKFNCTFYRGSTALLIANNPAERRDSDESTVIRLYLRSFACLLAGDWDTWCLIVSFLDKGWKTCKPNIINELFLVQFAVNVRDGFYHSVGLEDLN